MKALYIFIFALATLTLASSNLPRPIKLPKCQPQLYTVLDAYIPGLPDSNAYLQDLLTFSVNYAIGEGIKKEKLCRQAKWALGEVLATGHLQDTQSVIFFTFSLVAPGEDDVTVVVEVLDDPCKKKEKVVFFAFFENIFRDGTYPGLQWPISFSLNKVKDSEFFRSLIRLGIEYVLAQARKGKVLRTEKYELDSVVSVSIDVVDDVTFYLIDVSLILPGIGLTDSNVVIKDDPDKKDLSIVYSSLGKFDVLVDER